MNPGKVDSSISLFVFDLGGVLLDNVDFRELWLEHLGVDREEFIREYDRYLHPIMDGYIGPDVFCRHVEKVFGITVDGDPFYDFFHPGVNTQVLSLIEALKKNGKRVVAGTNNCVPHWRYITEHGWDRYFHRTYVSQLMGLTKPSAAFYNAILRAEGIPAENAIMIDDREENITGALKCGMKGFLLTPEYDRNQLFEDFSSVL